MGNNYGWSFEIDEDESIIPLAPSGTPENVRLAIETLIIPFSLNPEAVDGYLREWRRMQQEFQTGYVLGTASASAVRLSATVVEIKDLYGQFENCTIKVGVFEDVLERLVAYLNTLK